jgi:cobaltochelatase CobS
MVTIPGTDHELPVSDYGDDPKIPEIDPHYIFRSDLAKYCVYGIKKNKNVLLTGDAGTGKSSLVTQVAALIRQPLWRFNMNGETDTSKFVGWSEPGQTEGKPDMIYHLGIIALAMQKGAWVLLDEIDAALQPVLFVLQQVLEDGGKLMLDDKHHTVIEKHPNFRIFATANTVGVASKNKLLYSGTMGRMNEATLDRFGVVVQVPYLDHEDEKKVIQKAAPRLDDDFAEYVIRIANDVRRDADNEQVSCTFSTRRCIEWAQAMQHFHPVEAAKITILDKLNPDDNKALAGIIQRYFGDMK